MRVLVLPALFDEGNKLRRLALDVMRFLDHLGVDSFLPDFPGFNESLSPLEDQTLEKLRAAADHAASHFSATHLFTLRSAAILAPASLPGWKYAATGGSNILRSLIRSRTIAAKEVGREENSAQLHDIGRQYGLELAGYRLSAEFFTGLESAQLPDSTRLVEIDQAKIGGSGLWLRAEPSENREQAEALAAIIAAGLPA
jgi:hypothetical protein